MAADHRSRGPADPGDWRACGGCRSLIALDGPEQRFLALLVGADIEIEPWMSCNLQIEHLRDHYGLLGVLEGSAGQGGPDLWWVRWRDVGAPRELVSRDFCRALDLHPGRDPCTNPVGHGGAHHWAYDPLGLF